jgi:uncharacterized membrane protein YdjX (TVP38/TMEM64 family)
LKNTVKLIAFAVLLAAFIFTAHYFGLGAQLGRMRGWIVSLGYWGPAVYIVVYALAVTLLVPGSALTLAAGAIFGSLWGVVIVSIASTAGAAIAFIISRYLARTVVEGWLRRNEKFSKLDELTDKNGGVIVAITRLVPLFPYTLLNYGFGLTKVSFKTYLFWSWLCMLPGTVLYVAGGDAAAKTIIHGKLPLGLIGLFAAAMILIFFLVKYAKGRLGK